MAMLKYTRLCEPGLVRKSTHGWIEEINRLRAYHTGSEKEISSFTQNRLNRSIQQRSHQIRQQTPARGTPRKIGWGVGPAS